MPTSTRALMIITIVADRGAVAAIAAWWVTRQPAPIPVDVPSIDQA
jgi:hypothetical protein